VLGQARARDGAGGRLLSRGAARRLVVALGLLLGAACRDAEPPAWTSLAAGWRPEGGADAWRGAAVPRAAWVYQERVGVWSTEAPLRGLGAPAEGPPQRLAEPGPEGRAFSYVSPIGLFAGGPDAPPLEPGGFFANEGRLRLYLGPDEEPPAELEFAVYAGRGAEELGAWRVRGRRFASDGIPVWPGERVALRVRLAPGTSLRFAATVEPAAREPAGPVRFAVELDGREVFAHAEPRPEAASWHAVELAGADEPARDAELVLRVDGPFAYTSFGCPTLGPSAIGGPGRRPWGGRRDLVVFQADTFRADNLALYGGDLELTPNLDRLAERALRFRNAWSTGTYTLSAHATMFTGLYPRQAGILAQDHAVSEGLLTIAELLGRSGYRTAAITEATLVSQRYGLDRGFQWWDESRVGLEDTLRRANEVLDADDGRPLFLFVQTYRAHAPYEVSERTRSERGEELGIEGSFERLSEARAAGRHGGEKPTREEDARLVEAIRRHYLGAVVDLDRGFAGFLRSLEDRGRLRSGALVFTSDHGEAFNEHAQVYHAGWPYEEQARIPLLLVGQGIAPGDVDLPASLIDLAPTLADLAGLRPPREWEGRSLLGLDAARPLYVFQAWNGKIDSTFAIVDGGRKVIGFEPEEARREGRLAGAFDLGADPAERVDLRDTAAWPGRLLEERSGALDQRMTPRAELRSAAMDEEQRRALEAMGYLGEEAPR